MIAVLGSINVDLVTCVERPPRPGETVPGTRLRRYPGGKGANQAVAAARMGQKVALFGKVGADTFGEEVVRALAAANVNTAYIERESDEPTGCALVTVASDGENTIVYIPGANARLDWAYVERVFERISAADLLLVQLEIPIGTVRRLLQRLPKPRPYVILDPAPPEDIRGLDLGRVDLLTPNRGELAVLTGEPDLHRAAHKLLQLGVKRVACKDGEHGSHLFTPEFTQHFPAFEVTPVDTTGAGDAFNGAMAAAWASGLPLEEAFLWANAAGALATTRPGAQAALPRLDEVNALLKSVFSG